MEHGFDPSEGNYSLFSLRIHDQPILSAHFKKAGVTRIIIAGFGYEYSVLHTALGACQLSNNGDVSVIVVADACCPCDFVLGMDQVADDELLSEQRITIMSSYEIPSVEDAIEVTESTLEVQPTRVTWRTELHRLAADRSKAAIRMLKQIVQVFSKKHNPFALDWFGNSCLIVAASHRNTAAIVMILLLLTKCTSSAEAKAGEDNKPAHRLKRKTRLLKHVNHQGLHGMTALMWAAASHDLRGVKALLRHGALPTKGLSLGHQNTLIFATSMHLSNQAFAVVRELIKACSKNQAAALFTDQDKRGWSAFHFASLNGLLGDLDLTLLVPRTGPVSPKDSKQRHGKRKKTSSPIAAKRVVVKELSIEDFPEQIEAKTTSQASKKRVVPAHSTLTRKGSEAWNRGGTSMGDVLKHTRTDGSGEGLLIEARTVDEYTPLHLASWSGANASVVALLDMVSQTADDAKEDIFRKNTRISRFVNSTVEEFTPLDLMIQEGHSHCIPLLLKQNAFAQQYRGDRCTELLHRSILFGDQSTAERILQFDENEVDTNEDVLHLVDSLQHVFPASCTSTFSKNTDDEDGRHIDGTGFAQYMYRCIRCDAVVCLVCRERCHKDHGASERLGACPDTEYETCGCDKGSCCALGSASIREMEGYRYDPTPVDTGGLVVDPALTDEALKDRNTPLGRLAFDLARNSHEVWAKQRQEDGWRYGSTRDDSKKVHPSLRPFGQLSDRDRSYNESAAREAIRVVHSFSFAIVPDDTPSSGRRATVASRRTRRRMEDSSASLLSMPSRRASIDRSMISVLEQDANNPANVLAADAETDGDSGSSPSSPNTEETTSKAAGNDGEGSKSPSGEAGTKRSEATETKGLPKRHDSFESVETRDSADGDSPKMTSGMSFRDAASLDAQWTACPVNTRHVFISHKLSNLIELLAKNDHDVWAKSKIQNGWRFAPGRVSEKAMTTPMLVPYEMLSTAEKSRLRQSAVEMVKIVIHSGFKITCTNATISGNLIRKLRERERQMLSGTTSDSSPGKENPSTGSKRVEAASKITQFKVAVRTALLMRASRSGDAVAVRILLEHLPKSSVNHCDHFKHTPVYLAVKRGHTSVVEVLLEFKADASFSDINHLTPLAIAAQLGNGEMCETLIRLTKGPGEAPSDGRNRLLSLGRPGLLFRQSSGNANSKRRSTTMRKSWQSGATILTTDRWGLSPLHRAACLNHTDVCKVLYSELATIKDMDVDLTALAQVSRVLSVLKDRHVDPHTPQQNTRKIRKRPSSSSSSGHRVLHKTMSARDLVTSPTASSAFVRGMQNLTSRLFGGSSTNLKAAAQSAAKVTPHELVELQQHEKHSAISRQLWNQVKNQTVLKQKRRKAVVQKQEDPLETMQQDIDRIGVGIFAPTTPLGMATCLRCLDAVRFLVAHGADPTLTTPIKIYREKRNDSVFGKLKSLKDKLLHNDDPLSQIQNHGMSPYQVALFVYHELRIIRQTIEDDHSDDAYFAADADTGIVKSLDVNIDVASKMIDELNEARMTKSVRDWFAVRRCSTAIIPNLFMWILLLFASPSFYDGYLNYDSFVFKREIEVTLDAALSEPGLRSNDPTVWLNTWRRDPSLDGLFRQEWDSLSQPSFNDSCRIQFNNQVSFLVGPLQFQVRKFPQSQNCSGAEETRWFGQVCICNVHAPRFIRACGCLQFSNEFYGCRTIVGQLSRHHLAITS